MRNDIPDNVRLIGGIVTVTVTVCLWLFWLMLPVFIGGYVINRWNLKEKVFLTSRGVERYRRRHPGQGDASFLPGLFFRRTRRPTI